MRNEMHVVKVSVNKVMMFVASSVTSLRIWQRQQALAFSCVEPLP